MFFFDQIREAVAENPSEDLIVRVNTIGGEPDYMLSIVEKIQEISDQVIIKGNAQMHSAGFFLMAYVPVDRVEVADITQSVLHRAAYPNWMESSTDFPGSPYEITLSKLNKNMEKALRARIDVAALEALPQMAEKGIKLKDIFSMESRIEVALTATDLKKIGLVSKINKITPTKQAELTAMVSKFESCKSFEDLRAAASVTKEETEPNSNTMTLDELKSKFPAVYAQAKAEGVAEGIADERDRVGAFLPFADIDLKAVTAGIESGKKISQKETSEFLRKSMSAEAIKKIQKDSPADVDTGEEQPVGGDAAKTAEQKAKEKKKADFEASLDASLGLKKSA